MLSAANSWPIFSAAPPRRSELWPSEIRMIMRSPSGRAARIFLHSTQRMADARAAHVARHFLRTQERRGRADRGEILSQRHPVQHLGAERGQTKRVAFAKAGEFDDRFERFVGAFAVAEGRHHAAGDIEAELDVGEHARVGGFRHALRAGEQKNRDGEQAGRGEVAAA